MFNIYFSEESLLVPDVPWWSAHLGHCRWDGGEGVLHLDPQEVRDRLQRQPDHWREPHKRGEDQAEAGGAVGILIWSDMEEIQFKVWSE